MERLLELKTICLELAVTNTDYHMDEETWNKVKLVVDILALFAHKMTFLQKSNLSLADVYGVWFELECRLKKIENCSLAKNLSQRLIFRGAERHIFENDVTLAALFLDLRFHFMLTSEQKEKAKNHLLCLWQRIDSKKKESGTNIDLPTMQTKQTASHVDYCDDALEMIMREMEFQQSNSDAGALSAGNISILEEIAKFSAKGRIIATNDMSKSWEADKFTFPILYELARTIMAVAPTEVSVERNFSTLDFILNKRRNRLSDPNLEMILFTKLNHPLFYDAIERQELDFD